MYHIFRASIIGAFFLCLIGSRALAVPDQTFLRAQSHLPKTIYPERYDLRFAPNFVGRTIDGDERVQLRFTAPSATVAFYAKNLRLDSVTIDGIRAQSDVLFDSVRGLHRFHFPEAFRAGEHILQVRYVARLATVFEPEGMFTADSRDGESLATHLEPVGARKLFPSWDEPVYKARFSVTIVVPRNFTALSNMPATRTEPVGEFSKEVHFATTPPMATYLVAVCAGKYAHVARVIDGTPVTVYTMPSQIWSARDALRAAEDSIPYYERYFGIHYMMPKLDIVAVPSFNTAMENWGLIVGGEHSILLRPWQTVNPQRQYIWETVVHEIAHQWTGDLVTHDAWNDLWLTEGFAQWMQDRIERKIHPEWARGNYALANRDFSLWGDHGHEAIRETGSRRWTVSFSSTQYEKSANLINVLVAAAGEENFQRGLHRYLLDRAYRSGSTTDFLAAMNRASARNLLPLANRWLYQRGVPHVAVEIRCRGTQEEISYEQSPKTWVPLLLADHTLLDRPSYTRAAPCKTIPEIATSKSYFRVAFGPNLFALFEHRFAHLPTIQRDLAYGDLMQSDVLAPVPLRLLPLSAQMTDADDPYLTRSAFWLAEDFLNRAQHGAHEQTANAYVREHFSSTAMRLLTDANPDTTVYECRVIALRALATAGDPAVVRWAQSKVDSGDVFDYSRSHRIEVGASYAIGVHASAAEHAEFLAKARADASNLRAPFWYQAYFAQADPEIARDELAVWEKLPEAWQQWSLNFWSIERVDPLRFWKTAIADVRKRGVITMPPKTVIAAMAPHFSDAQISSAMNQWYEPQDVGGVAKQIENARTDLLRNTKELDDFLTSQAAHQ